MAKKKPVAKPATKQEDEPVEEKAERNRRYEVGLAKSSDPCCFVTFHKCDTFVEAKDKCIDKACDEDRECIVWDNEEWNYPIVFRYGNGVRDDRTNAAH